MDKSQKALSGGKKKLTKEKKGVLKKHKSESFKQLREIRECSKVSKDKG